MSFEYQGVKITWLGHDTFTFEKGGTMICTDPFKLSKSLKPTVVLISHNHFDHLSMDDLKKVCSSDTTVVAAKECLEQLKDLEVKDKIGVSPGDEKNVDGIKVKAVRAYNVDKINPDTGKPFHPKEDDKVGYVVDLGGTTVYHTGDSDVIPEMDNIQPDVLLVPVSGTYVMTANEAVQAVEKIKPKVAIPMHYGTIVGGEEDAKSLRDSVKSCKVEILSKE